MYLVKVGRRFVAAFEIDRQAKGKTGAIIIGGFAVQLSVRKGAAVHFERPDAEAVISLLDDGVLVEVPLQEARQ